MTVEKLKIIGFDLIADARNDECIAGVVATINRVILELRKENAMLNTPRVNINSPIEERTQRVMMDCDSTSRKAIEHLRETTLKQILKEEEKHED